MIEEPEVEERGDILESLGASRAIGVRFYREYIGIRAAASAEEGCGSLLLARKQSLGPRGAVHPGALATLADVSLAWVLRGQVSPYQRMATFGLTLRVIREIPAAHVYSCAEMISTENQVGIARCRLTGDRGVLLAEATGSFAIRVPLKGTEWRMRSPDSALDGPARASLRPEELNDEERRMLEHAERTASRRSLDGPYVDFLGIEWLDRGDGRVDARWPLGPHLWNRSGHVHGGAVFGALAAAAAACLPAEGQPSFVEQYVQYVRPVTGEGIRLEAGLLRRGQRLISVEAAVLDAEGRTLARALTTLQNGGDEDQ